jgi:ABC-2 type transport system permease protein
MGLKNSMEYRANFLISIISVIFPVTIQYFLWTAVFKASSQKVVYGYDYHQMIAYAISSAIIVKFTAGGFEWEIADDVKNGGLSKFIIRPVGYIKYRISSFLGTKSVQALIMLVIMGGIYIAMQEVFDFQLTACRACVFLLALFMALILNFMIIFSISMSAFWINEVWGIFVIFNLLNSVVCGGVFPLDIFGKNILKLFDYLPFKYVIYYPVNILTGRTSIDYAGHIIILQMIWIGVMLLVANFLWKIGMKKYTAAGG